MTIFDPFFVVFPFFSEKISLLIPSSVTCIKAYTFSGCTLSITFQGSKERWQEISELYPEAGEYTIHCTDGDIA